jgi:DNA-3-methyladenine glycosylase II
MSTSFTLEPRPPFRLDLTAWVLRRRPGNIVDRWDGNTYRRAMSIGGAVAEVEVRQTGLPDAPSLVVSVVTSAPVDARAATAAITNALDRLLGLDVDLEDFYGRVADDAYLGPLADRFRGLKPPRFLTMFECVANAIACQQLTLTVGITLLNRLAESHGRAGPGRAADHAFPEPGDLAGGDPAVLRKLGFSIRKATTVIDIAERITAGRLDLETLRQSDNDVAVAALQELSGVGRWSAEYALLRGLGRLEVFPGDDVGARNNLALHLGLPSALDYDGVRATVAPWAPYAGLAYFHLLAERIEAAGWIDSPEEVTSA